MKKLFAILLTLALILSMGAIAFAADNEQEAEEAEEAAEATPTYYDATLDTNTVNITKKLTAYGPTDTEVQYPGDVLKFSASDGVVTEATAGTEAPELPPIADVTIQEGAASATIVVKLPAFSTVGVYTYEITETDTNVAGVTYRTAAIKLVLTVVENDGKKVVAAVHCEAAGETKTDEFENVFNAGSLKVSKQVTGNYGDKERDWNFTVTFTAPEGDTVNSTIKYGDDQTIAAGWTGSKTVTFTLKHNESLQFDNIPAGVTYSVVESEANTEEYTTTYTKASGTIEAKTITEAKVENNRTTTPDTGIVLDSLPYILIAVAVMAAVVVMIAKKRRVED